MSIKRVAESVDLDAWIPATVEATTDLTAAILRIFRDQGGRKDRQKGRLMWLIEEYGEVKEVKGHPRVSEKFRKRVIKEMSTKVEKAQPKATAPFERRSLLGVHSQPQAGKSRVGVHVPVGRLSVAEARQIADLADKYSGGEIRLTVEQNIILPNVDDSALQALLAEPSLNGASRLSVEPGNIVGNLVSCTGAQFCGLALIETKAPAESTARELQKRVTVPKALRIHWTGCPNSCGQVWAAPRAPHLSPRAHSSGPPLPRTSLPAARSAPVAPRLNPHWLPKTFASTGAGGRHRADGRSGQEVERGGGQDEGGARLPDLRRRDHRCDRVHTLPLIYSRPHPRHYSHSPPASLPAPSSSLPALALALALALVLALTKLRPH